MNITTVYRVGPVIPGAHDATITDWFAKMDLYAPVGRQGRTGCIFAAPTMKAMNRWLSSRFHENMDGFDELLEVHEITVDADEVYVYSVFDYERVPFLASPSDARFMLRADAYWSKGVTLTRWLEDYEGGVTDEEDAEILLAETDVLGTTPVSWSQLVRRISRFDDRTAEAMENAPERFVEVVDLPA